MAHLDEAVFDERMATTAGLVDATMASYAIVSRPYAHLMIRFGYHFAMVDAYISNDPEANYAGFRFKGGGASFEQRLLRLEFLRLVLEAAGFETRIRGDLMDAQVRRGSREDTEEALRLLGVILARTRVMDMSMKDLGQARELAEEFAETYMGRSITAAE
jgi:pyruvate,water dikinase